jgi:hypothetical protein
MSQINRNRLLNLSFRFEVDSPYLWHLQLHVLHIWWYCGNILGNSRDRFCVAEIRVLISSLILKLYLLSPFHYSWKICYFFIIAVFYVFLVDNCIMTSFLRVTWALSEYYYLSGGKILNGWKLLLSILEKRNTYKIVKTKSEEEGVPW